MAEKTKLQLLEELNCELENKIKLLKQENEKLVGEIRVLKSSISEVESNAFKIDAYDKLNAEKKKVESDLANAKKQLFIQDKQIEILINGLNSLNIDTNKLFENVGYILGLAKDNYDKNFGTIQSNLNNLIPKEKEGDDK